MKTIFYLIDLHDKTIVETYEGDGDQPSVKAMVYADRRAADTSHTHVLARGVRFSQRDEGGG